MLRSAGVRAGKLPCQGIGPPSTPAGIGPSFLGLVARPFRAHIPPAGTQKQQDVKKEAFEPDGKALKSGVQNDIEFFVVKKRVHPKNKTNY